MKKLFALLLALCMMCGVVGAGAEEVPQYVETKHFSLEFPLVCNGQDRAWQKPDTYIYPTHEFHTCYDAFMDGDYVNVFTADADESVVQTYGEDKVAFYYYNNFVDGYNFSYFEDEYNFSKKYIEMFISTPVTIAVNKYEVGRSDEVLLGFYYEGMVCVLRLTTNTNSVNTGNTQYCIDTLCELAAGIRPTGMTDDELAALKAAKAAEKEAAQDELAATIIGVWNVDMKTFYMAAGLSSAEADLMLSLFPQSTTFTFTADHRYILTSNIDDNITEEKGSYQLQGDQLIVDGGGRSTLILDGDTLIIVDPDGTQMTLTRAASADTPTASAQPDWAVPADDTTEAVPTQYVIITNSSANIRSGPGGDYDKLTTARQGDTFPLIREEGNWYVIDVNGQTGYVTKSLSAIQ